MPFCEICGMEVVELYECSECESRFCAECGDVEHRLCYDCIGWEDDELEETLDDVEDWDNGWNDDEPH